MEQTFQPALVAGQAGQSRASSLRRSELVLLAYFGNTAGVSAVAFVAVEAWLTDG